MNTCLDALGAWATAWLPALLDSAVKGVVLLALAGLVATALRGKSAASRQLVWILALAAMLLLPLMSAALPSWQVLPGWAKVQVPAVAPPTATHVDAPPAPVTADSNLAQANSDAAPSPHAGSVATDTPPSAGVPSSAVTPTPSPLRPTASPHAAAPAMATPQAPTPRAFQWPSLLPWALMVWAAGAILCVGALALGRLSLRRLTRNSKTLADASWADLARRAAEAVGLRRPVVLLMSDREPMPMVWGIFRPRLLLPAEAENWPTDRRWAVLLHELAHARRFDCLAQFIAHIACACYWFNPLCWLAFKRMQAEAETACDDIVLSAGYRPSDYATHLVEIAAGLSSGMLAGYSSIAMARPSMLEGRLLAILDGRRNRRSLTRLGVLVAAVLFSAIVVPIAILKATAPTFYE